MGKKIGWSSGCKTELPFGGKGKTKVMLRMQKKLP
jgi:hypothetical protein